MQICTYVSQTAFSHAQIQLQATNKETSKQTFTAPELKKTPAIMTPSRGTNNIKLERTLMGVHIIQETSKQINSISVSNLKEISATSAQI